jgi:release factor glutamine methyltransferase
MAESAVELADGLFTRAEARWVRESVASLPEEERRARLSEIVARRRRGEPLQYVLGAWQFRTLELTVDRRALIPRPETELVVDVALEVLDGLAPGAVACDLGCGSGAIALSLAAESTAHPVVHATDVSARALELARANAARCGLAVTFHHGSWFEALPASLLGRVDLVCSNPPYVSRAERPTLARELDHEPAVALVAEDSTDGEPGMAAIEAILAGAAAWLRPGGAVVIEHGEAQRAASVACASHSGLSVVATIDDLAGRPRVLRAERPA